MCWNMEWREGESTAQTQIVTEDDCGKVNIFIVLNHVYLCIYMCMIVCKSTASMCDNVYICIFTCMHVCKRVCMCSFVCPEQSSRMHCIALFLHMWKCWVIISFPCTFHTCLLSFSLVDQPFRFFSERTSSPKWALSSVDIWARPQGCLTHGLLLCLLLSDCSHRSTFTRNGVRMLAMPIRYFRLHSQPTNSNEPVRTK